MGEGSFRKNYNGVRSVSPWPWQKCTVIDTLSDNRPISTITDIHIDGNNSSSGVYTDSKFQTPMVYARWNSGEKTRKLNLNLFFKHISSSDPRATRFHYKHTMLGTWPIEKQSPSRGDPNAGSFRSKLFSLLAGNGSLWEISTLLGKLQEKTRKKLDNLNHNK